MLDKEVACAWCAVMLVFVVGDQMRRFQATAGDKSLLLKAITILYDGAMKTLVTLLLACCFGGAMAQSNLPPCVGEPSRWDRCYGTERSYYIELRGFVGKYSGEWVQGKPDGQGVLIIPNWQGYVEASELPKNKWLDSKFVSDGGRYIGYFKSGLYNGFGIEYSGSGAVERSGVYEVGRFVRSDSVSLAMFGRLKYEPALTWVTLKSETEDALRKQRETVPQLAEARCKTLLLIFLDGLRKCLSDADHRKASRGFDELSSAIKAYERDRTFALYSTKPATLQTTDSYFGNAYSAWGWEKGLESQNELNAKALQRCELEISKRFVTAAGLECRLFLSHIDGSPGILKVALSSHDFVKIWPLAITGLFEQSQAMLAKLKTEPIIDSALGRVSSGEITSNAVDTPPELTALLAEVDGKRKQATPEPNELENLRAEAEQAKRKQAELEAQLAAVQQAPAEPTVSIRTQGKRVALVIGNAKYKFNPLNNPVNDATDMAASLRSVGFDVIEVKDATLKQMREATRRFADKLEVSDVGLVYYSGHGIEVKGTNYLIPVNADIRREYEVVDQAFDASNLLRMMESLQGSVKKRVNILIVDACRNNDLPKSWRSTNNGLARMDAPAGSFISFATAPGQVASDGNGRNSPYTKHLLNALKQPNVPIEQVFKQVRRNVMDETGGEQVPWENSSLIGDFYFTVAR